MHSIKRFLSIAILLSSAALYAAQSPKSGASAKDLNTNIAAKDVAIGGMTDLVVRYINTMEAMQSSKKGLEIQKELTTKHEELAKRVKKEEDKLQAAIADFKSKESTLNKNARGEQEAKIVKMQREFETLVKSCEDEYRLVMQQATEAMGTLVQETVFQMAVTNRWDVVVDIATGRTIYASEKAMVTPDLIKSMDKIYVAKAPEAKKTAAA